MSDGSDVVGTGPERTEPRGAPPARPLDVIALAQLWADQFQHMTTLAVAGAGGLLILLQVGVVSSSRHWWLSFALFAIAALLGMLGQATVVDDATAGSPPGRSVRVLRIGAFLAFGGAAYGVTRLLL